MADDSSHDVAIVLGRAAHDSMVLIDGHDITTACIGVDVHAHAGEITTIELTLSARVTITGEVGRLHFDKTPEAEP